MVGWKYKKNKRRQQHGHEDHTPGAGGASTAYPVLLLQLRPQRGLHRSPRLPHQGHINSTQISWEILTNIKCTPNFPINTLMLDPSTVAFERSWNAFLSLSLTLIRIKTVCCKCESWAWKVRKSSLLRLLSWRRFDLDRLVCSINWKWTQSSNMMYLVWMRSRWHVNFLRTF